jgi:hypothetical protein
VAAPSLDAFLATYLGAWPPVDGAVDVIGSSRREDPAWDGRIQPFTAVVAPFGAVLSVTPDRVEAVKRAVGGRQVAHLPAAYRAVAAAVAGGNSRIMEGVFRWSEAPVDGPDAGIWLDAGDERVPRWLRPFGREVLVVLQDDRYVAGVGLKRHDPTGQEIAVGTEEWARGRGLARQLVAQAARRVLAGGAVVTYIHALDNRASGQVAQASCFPDLGWKALFLAGQG